MKATRGLGFKSIIVPPLRSQCTGMLRIRRFAIYLFLLGVVFHRASFCSCNSLKAAEPASMQASLRGDAIELKPARASFHIPREWVDWHTKYHDNLHLSPTDLAEARVADGEWDKEYAEVVNALLPFNNCVAHVGGEGWGKNGYSFGDVQMRAYVVDLSPKRISQCILKSGPSNALRFSKKASIRCATFDDWQRVTLSYPLWYSDYGGTANIDVFSRAIGGQTAVLVFMYAEPTAEMRHEVTTIVKSFRWKPWSPSAR
jgi:hypothetical protein